MRARQTAFLRSRLGATLAEGILAVFISSMFLSVLPGFYLSSIKLWRRESGRIEAVHTADFALRRIEEEARNARAATVSSSGTTVTLTLPKRQYEAGLDRQVNVIDAFGRLQDGDRIQYYVTPSEGAGAAMFRRVVQADGTAGEARVVVDQMQPSLNPLDEDAGTPRPVFSYDDTTRTLTITVTAAEPEPSTGTFAPTETTITCARDGGELVRVATEEHPEGEIQCSLCGTRMKTNVQLCTHETRFLLRNE